MSRCRRLPFVTALALVMPACDLTDPGQNFDSLENGFASMLLGYDNVQSSFDDERDCSDRDRHDVRSRCREAGQFASDEHLNTTGLT